MAMLLAYILRLCRRGRSTGVGEDNGIDHNQNWLRFPYDSTFLRSHYLSPPAPVGVAYARIMTARAFALLVTAFVAQELLCCRGLSQV